MSGSNAVLMVAGVALLLALMRVLDLSNFVWSLSAVVVLAAPALLAFMVVRANVGVVPAFATAATMAVAILLWSYRRPAEDWRKLWMLSRIEEFLKGLVRICLLASAMVLAGWNFAVGPWLAVGLPLAAGSGASWLLARLSRTLLFRSVHRNMDAYGRNMARLRRSESR